MSTTEELLARLVNLEDEAVQARQRQSSAKHTLAAAQQRIQQLSSGEGATRQWTRPVCGFGAFSQLNIRQGCCRRRLLRRRQWSLEQGELLHLATSFETTRCIGIQTAAAANMAKMRGLSELVGVQLVSRARYLSLSEQRPGELYMDRSLESYRALIVRNLGPFFNCWSVLWAIWLLARTASIWSSAFISAGLARAASRMVTCGVESGLQCIPATQEQLKMHKKRTNE